MPTDYVEDYEEVSGKKREVEVKVIKAPETDTPIFAATKAETK